LTCGLCDGEERGRRNERATSAAIATPHPASRFLRPVQRRAQGYIRHAQGFSRSVRVDKKGLISAQHTESAFSAVSNSVLACEGRPGKGLRHQMHWRITWWKRLLATTRPSRVAPTSSSWSRDWRRQVTKRQSRTRPLEVYRSTTRSPSCTSSTQERPPCRWSMHQRPPLPHDFPEIDARWWDFIVQMASTCLAP
jgi:hypothetical protein